MFQKASGQKYARFLLRLHQSAVFDWYLEIGCRTGTSFAPVRGPTIGVDPFFKITTEVIGSKPILHLFQTTSDAFFESRFLEKNGIRLPLAFIDGMHLIEYALRDFINLERNAAPGGVIMAHDVCPYSDDMERRDLANLVGREWTGDVWKLIPILREYRPDLEATVFDCAPTGLLAVRGLDPSNSVLSDRFDEIMARYQEIRLAEFGLEAFNGSFTFADARAESRNGFPLFETARSRDQSIAAPKFVSP